MLLKTYPSFNFIRREDGNSPPIPDARGTLQGMPFRRRDVSINAGSVVEVEPGKVQLADVPRVVHVTQEYVHVLRCAEAWNIH